MARQSLHAMHTLSTLRNHHRVSLQVLRKIGAWLSERYDPPWSKLRFYVCGKTIVFADPATGKLVPPAAQGQTLLKVALEQVASTSVRPLKSSASAGRIGSGSHQDRCGCRGS